MMARLTLTLSPGRRYFAYLDGSRIEVEASIDGHPVYLGCAHWDGHALDARDAHLRPDVVAALSAEIARIERVAS